MLSFALYISTYTHLFIETCFICNAHFQVLVIYLFFVFLPFLGLLLRHMEVPRLGGRIGAVATSLHHSHNNEGSRSLLQPTPQLTATLDRQPTEQGQVSNPKPHGS